MYIVDFEMDIQNWHQYFIDSQLQAMEEDEVVNCRCHHPEGDGMMVQVIQWP